MLKAEKIYIAFLFLDELHQKNLTPHPPSHPSRSPLQGEMAEDEAFCSCKGEQTNYPLSSKFFPVPSPCRRGLGRGHTVPH